MITITKSTAGYFLQQDRRADYVAFLDFLKTRAPGFVGASFAGDNPDQISLTFDPQSTTQQAASNNTQAALLAYAAESLEALKAEVCRKITAVRDGYLFSWFSFDNKRWDCDANSRSNITGANALAILAGGQLPPGTVWRDSDNTNHPVNAQYMVQMGAAVAGYTSAVYQASWTHKDAVRALGDAQSVNAYNYQTGWPDR